MNRKSFLALLLAVFIPRRAKANAVTVSIEIEDTEFQRGLARLRAETRIALAKYRPRA